MSVEGTKTFLSKRYGNSDAVSKLGKTHLVFMQPGAKINSVYYSDNVLEQGLLLGILHLSNDDSLFLQYGAPAHRSRQTCLLYTSDAADE